MWTPDLKLNTVHITDLCRSIVFLSKRNDTINETYNLVDKGNTTQGTIANIVADIFQINHDYWGSAMSSLAKVSFLNLF